MKQISSFSGEYRFLSNFYKSKVLFDGIKYPSSEHAYVAHKTLDQNMRLKISKIDSPAKVKRIGREIDLRSDWEEVKISIMRNIVEAKFDQNEYIMNKLLQTKGFELIEGNTWGDVIWGQCPLGTGRNELGKILMSIRDDITRGYDA